MKSSYFVAAYATSPSHSRWDPKSESKYFNALANDSRIIGLEQPYYRSSEKYSLDWLENNIPQHWDIIITTLPIFMQELQNNPNIGIASNSERDRKNAIALIQEIKNYCEALQKRFNRNIVRAIHLHTAPSNKNARLSDKNSLKKSLEEIKAMHWGNINLNIEHCDAVISNQMAEKGYLSIEDEIEAVESVGGFGMVLNWARSAIEMRSIQGPLKHIQLLQSKNLLKGFFYSGCTDKKENAYGYWHDTHMPPVLPNCLLDEKSLSDVKALLTPDIYLGIKVADIHRENNPEQSARFNCGTIDLVEKA